MNNVTIPPSTPNNIPPPSEGPKGQPEISKGKMGRGDRSITQKKSRPKSRIAELRNKQMKRIGAVLNPDERKAILGKKGKASIARRVLHMKNLPKNLKGEIGCRTPYIDLTPFMFKNLNESYGKALKRTETKGSLEPPVFGKSEGGSKAKKVEENQAARKGQPLKRRKGQDGLNIE